MPVDPTRVDSDEGDRRSAPFAPALQDQDLLYERYRRMRSARTFERNHLGAWLSKYEECVQVLGDSRFRSAGDVAANPRSGSNLLFIDGAAHRELRQRLGDALPKANLALRDFVTDRCHSLLERLRSGDRVDLVQSYARPVAASVTAFVLGLGAESEPLLRDSLEPVHALMDPSATDEERVVGRRAQLRLMQLVRRQIVKGSSPNGSGLLPGLVKGQASIGAREVAWLCTVCSMMGHASYENTSNFISEALLLCLRNRRIRDQITTEDPAISPIEELVRLTSPAHTVSRRATQTIQLPRGEIHAGDQVYLVLGAANRDPDAFENPDLVVMPRARTHLGFGYGPHYCLGASVARAESTIALKLLLHRFPDCRVDGRLSWRGFTMRGLQTLPVSL